jgi:plasmid maintenance system antidote protein VapI
MRSFQEELCQRDEAHEKQISSLQESVSSLQESVSSLQESVSSLQESVSSLRDYQLEYRMHVLAEWCGLKKSNRRNELVHGVNVASDLEVWRYVSQKGVERNIELIREAFSTGYGLAVGEYAEHLGNASPFVVDAFNARANLTILDHFNLKKNRKRKEDLLLALEQILEAWKNSVRDGSDFDQSLFTKEWEEISKFMSESK